MDFTKFDTAASSSIWVHLEIDKRKLFWDGESVTLEVTDNPCRIKLRGVGSNDVFEAFERYQRAEMAHASRLQKAKGAEIDNITALHAEKAEGLMDDLIVAACEGWENMYFNGKDESITPALVRQLINRKAGHSNRAIRAFIFQSIADRRANLIDAA